MNPVMLSPVDRTTSPHVLILMATHNGDAYLKAQLKSISSQDHKNWSLVVSDDGSHDTTLRILEDFTRVGHSVSVLPGPLRGAAANFMSLLCRAPEHASPQTYIAFADQDDVWMPDRLSRGLRALALLPGAQPAAWCSRTLVTGPRLENPRLSAARPRPLSFCNALVENVMSGNTVLLNPAASQLASHLAGKTGKVVMHDWWLYLILTGSGAQIIHEERPCLYYRQHRGNEIGSNDGVFARILQVPMLLTGRFRRWNGINLAAIAVARPFLTPESDENYSLIARTRNGPLGVRIAALRKVRVYRQSRICTAGMLILAMLGLF